MAASIQETLHGNIGFTARHAATCMVVCGLLAGTPLGAQEVTRVYPRYVIAGQETHFTIEGRRLPLERSGALGMKHSFANPADCSNARHDKPSTSTRYYFACKFKSGADIENARLSISHQLKPKTRAKVKAKPSPGVSVKLWEGSLQVLPGAPRIDSLTVVGELDSGRTTVHCNSIKTCTTVVGDLRPGKPVVIDVNGSNLPFTLQLRFAACKSGSVPPDFKNTTSRSFTCMPRAEGEQTLRVLSAAQNEGGTELHAGQVTVQQVSTTPVAQ